MTTALAKLDELGIVPKNEEQLNEIVASSGSTKYPRYLSLYGSNSGICKEGKFAVGHWGVARGQDDPEDIGDSFDCIPLDVRNKAIDTKEGIYNYDKDSEEYKRIATEADKPGPPNGCMYGPEFLIWIPSLGEMVTYHMNNKTGRKEAKTLIGMLASPVTLKSKLIKTPKFAWHGPMALKCSAKLKSVPVTTDNKEVVVAFQNPTSSEVAEKDERAR